MECGTFGDCDACSEQVTRVKRRETRGSLSIVPGLRFAPSRQPASYRHLSIGRGQLNAKCERDMGTMNWSKSGKVLIFASGWIATVFLGILDLPQKVHSSFESYPKAKEDVATWWNLNTDFSGSWTNEGDVATAEKLEPVALRMRVYGGRVDGEIWSDGLKNTIHPVILLGGTVRYGELDAYAFDFIGGQQAIFARFKITKKGDDLILTTVEQPIEFFPKEAQLFPSPDALKDKPLINFELIEKALKIRPKR